jgi:hypothetical protein
MMFADDYYSSYNDGGTVAAVLIGYFVVWLLFALAFGFAGRALMRSKGRSTAAGFCLGFFLGVIGLLIAALQSTTPEYEAEKMRQQMALMGLPPVQAQAYGQYGGVSGSSFAAASPARQAQWSADPYNRHEYRYWDGETWTNQVADGGVSSVDSPTPNPKPAELASPIAAVPAEVDLHDGHTVARSSLSSFAPPMMLVFDEGQRTALATPVVVGRSPIALARIPNAALVSYPDNTMTVSKTHFAIGPDGAGVWVEDISSSNGTVVVDPNGAETQLEPGRRVTTPVGSVVRFGDRWLRVEQGA